MVLRPSSDAASAAAPSSECALTASTTRSCSPASAAVSTALTGAVETLPSCQCSVMPFCAIARKCAPRPITVTSAPAAASRAAINPPIAPAPKMQIRMALV